MGQGDFATVVRRIGEDVFAVDFDDTDVELAAGE